MILLSEMILTYPHSLAQTPPGDGEGHGPAQGIDAGAPVNGIADGESAAAVKRDSEGGVTTRLLSERITRHSDRGPSRPECRFLSITPFPSAIRHGDPNKAFWEAPTKRDRDSEVIFAGAFFKRRSVRSDFSPQASTFLSIY